MESLFLSGLFGTGSALFKHLLAVLNNLVLLYHFLVFVTLELGERISILSFIARPFQLAHELVSFSCLCGDELLLFINHLLE